VTDQYQTNPKDFAEEVSKTVAANMATEGVRLDPNEVAELLANLKSRKADKGEQQGGTD
jgi:hypothetical protein